MKYKILLAAFVAALVTGCSSAYKASQTPDDVYYSPARKVVVRQTANADRYEDYVSSQDDQYLRMKIQDRSRWSTIDDYAYWNDSRYVPSYSYNYYVNNWYSPYTWNSMYSPSYSYNSFYGGSGLALGNNYGSYYGSYYPQFAYGPYMSTYITKRPAIASPNVNRPNLNGYNNRNYNNNNNNVNYNRQGVDNTRRRIYTPSENSSYTNRNTNTNTNTNTNRSVERSYTPTPSPSSSGSSSSGGSSHSSGGVSRPPR